MLILNAETRDFRIYSKVNVDLISVCSHESTEYHSSDYVWILCCHMLYLFYVICMLLKVLWILD